VAHQNTYKVIVLPINISFSATMEIRHFLKAEKNLSNEPARMAENLG